MFKNKIAILTVSILVVLSLVGFKNLPIDNSKVDKIELFFKGNPVANYSCVLTTPANIKESLSIFQQLKTYESPSVLTWYEEVTYKITYKNGKIKQTTYNKIRPVTDIFEKVFSSLEVRKQWQSVFTVNNSDVKSLKLNSCQKKAEITITEKDDINKIMNSVRLFEEKPNVLANTYSLCEMVFIDDNGVELGSYYIKREDIATNLLLKEYKILNILKVEPKDILKITITNRKTNKEIEVVDLDVTNLILDTYFRGATSDSVVDVAIKLKNDNRTHMYGSYTKEHLPFEIAKLLNIE
ncbi:hypothetical protein IMX26_01155 [Clostridium sp. 'deep sea']|uniref:hypothetical protein n=1 Tax=Clostridium sp. 'deep sea' TaxID=2779445 RepID=UPI0018965C5F|nr:hypothetical protein [Clostridium sp. 'deep sea']QOR35484.1 hypothetical protein IMX26_01155 [Clostridium sp. 'deep sea']